MDHATLTIEGMSCEHCVGAVRRALEEVPGVEVERVEIGSAAVAHEPGTAALERAARAIEEEGYRVAARTAR